MIIFPRVPEPASLLWTENPSRRANALRDECRQIAQVKRHRPIELLCRDTEALGQQGDRSGCAVLLIHLSDICRAKGRLGPALKLTDKAEQLLQSWPENRRKHNHAVALYSLGLVHHLLGSDQEAWDFYDRALDAFQQAKEQWSRLNQTEWAACCDEVSRWIERLMSYVAATRALGGKSAIQLCALLGCWSPGENLSETDQPIVDMAIGKIELNVHLRLGNETYQLQPLDRSQSSKLAFSLREQHFVLEVLEELPNCLPEFQGADYALVNRSGQRQEQDFGTAIGRDNTVLWGKFTRDTHGRIQFEVAHPGDPLVPRIIGGEYLEEQAAGSVVGVFKKVA